MEPLPSHRLETEALIEAIWGSPTRSAAGPTLSSKQRALQNAALAAAMRAYLQEYLNEVGPEDAG